MTTVVAIFDRAEQVEDAVNRLATARLDAAVVDETSLAQEPGSVDPVGLLSCRVPPLRSAERDATKLNSKAR